MENLSAEQALVKFRSTTVRERPDDAMLDFLCVRTTKPVKVSKDGVCYNNLYYGGGNEEVLKRIGQKVLLKVQPDTADYVDVCELDGTIITRAKHQWLRGITQDDIRTVKSLKKKMTRHAKQLANLPPAYKQNDTMAVLKAHLDRLKSEQAPVEPEEPVLAIQPVRPDLRESVANLHKSEEQKAIDRHVPDIPLIDFSAINQELRSSSDIQIDEDELDTELEDFSDVVLSNPARPDDTEMPDELLDLFDVLNEAKANDAKERRA